jgi:glycosyltransferase involved in cell wall biosynthesis
MKIVHIGPGGASGRGGIGRYIAYATAAARDHAPDLRIEVIDSYGTRGAWAMPFTFALACVKTASACLFGGADILHIHMSQGGSVLRKGLLLLLGRFCGARVIVHIHGSRFQLSTDRLPGWARRLFVGLLAQADRVIVIAAVWERYALDLGLPQGKVVLLHNGVPDPNAPPRAAGDGPANLLCLGELGERKGTGDLVAALTSPDLRALPWRAVIAGNGAVARYRAAVGSADIAERIVLPGWVSASAVQKLLGEADILILPSHHEGLPLAILEAMAAEVAVISTPVGGIPDAVIDGQTGLLAGAGDRAALARAMARLIRDSALRRDIARRGRLHFERCFDLRITFPRLAALYRELAPARPSASSLQATKG